MVQLSQARVALSASLTLDDESLKQHTEASPHELGQKLARAVHEWVVAHNTGYYPALSFFRQQDDFDQSLLDECDRYTWKSCQVGRELIMQALRPVCSRVEIRSLMSLVMTMPRVRPGQDDALALLAECYTPNRIKAGLVLSSIDKEPAGEGYAVGVSRKAHFWLSEVFAEVQLAFDRET
ncbi:MAG: hypothetical protein PVH46_02455 [Granulosicoccaceae bacterium]|jgi:hypothetical protein